MSRTICWFNGDLTVGDICNLFEGQTNAYEYRLAVKDDVIVLVEP